MNTATFQLHVYINNKHTKKCKSINNQSINNIDHYHFVSEIHNRNTRHGFNLNLYNLPVNLSLYHRGSYCMGIKIFNSLPLRLKQLYKDVKHFKSVLKEFLFCHSFYTLTEYFEYSNMKG
jgi:hypothetical protein